MIVHIAYSGVGGTGSFVGELCPRLGMHNGRSSRVIFYGVEPLHPEYGRRLADAGVPYSVVGKRPGLDMRSIYALSRAIRKASPEVVVMHGGGTAWLWPLLRLMGVRARLVLVEHGSEVARNAAGPFTWSVTRHVIGILCAETVIAVSDPLAEGLRRRFRLLLRSKPLWSIPNGVDTESFVADGARCGDIVLSVATLSPAKDHETLIRAYAMLGPPHSAHLVFAGDGILRTQLEQLSEACGVRDDTAFLGNVGRKRLLELYRQAAIFVLSTKGEGISLALLEAMSCGLPIVASDVPGVREVLQGTDCAILVPQGRPAEMAQAIGSILGNPELGTRMGARARACVTVNYSVERMVSQYTKVLNAF